MWSKEWTGVLLKFICSNCGPSRLLALSNLVLLLVDSPSSFEKSFEQSGGYSLLYKSIKDLVDEEEQEDAYAILLDLLLGHR